MGRGWRHLEVCVGGSLDFHEGPFGRKLAIRGDSGEITDWREESYTESLLLPSSFFLGSA